jgi:ParB family transcriptional regulator, chromosome partitioning protein
MIKASENPRKALGKGLSALISTRTAPKEPEPVVKPEAAPVSRLRVDGIDPNPLQPRTTFNAERLQELADSIRANGIIQPLVVRTHGGRFQLVAGERRWRAAKIAGLTEVPVVVEEISDDRLLEITLVENIQREDLNPIEVATAFERLSRELHLSHEQIAQQTGKDRTTITNMLRLLKLPTDLQQLLAERRLSMGHARALIALPTEELQRQVAEKATSQGLSVRQVERLVQRMTSAREPKAPEEPQDPNVKAAIQEMERILGTRVRILGRAESRGRIEIDFFSPDDLQRIYALIVGEAASA